MGITVLCHFHKNDLMPVIKCKNDKHLVTLDNAIFSNMTGILLHLSKLSSINTIWQQCANEMRSIGKLICLTKLIRKRFFFNNLGQKRVLG